MNKKIIGSILMQLAIFSFVLPASANYDETYNSGVTGFESEFGSCAVDPVYQDEFIGKATVSSRIRNRACMADSEVIATVSANAEVKVKYKTDGWYRVVLSDGTAG
ncbi:SH3 domain-containing protein, partial [Candidatus Falkowbacteria bacterium]|nr:SH3 domain-containing protein [Candidatus Falkowbacteria bacterium]